MNKITLNLLKIYIHILEPSRRGDMEILIYNLIHWLTGGLPWLNLCSHKNEENVYQLKKE
jgi:hypothetical protein